MHGGLPDKGLMELKHLKVITMKEYGVEICTAWCEWGGR